MNDKRIFRADSQLLSSISKCHLRAERDFLRNLIPFDTKPAFSRGLYGHAILEGYTHHFLETKNRQDSIDFGFESGLKWALDNQIDFENQHLIDKNLRGYFEYYKSDRWELKGAEKYLSSILYENDDLIILYDGRVDWFIETDYGPCIADHKFRSRDNPFYELKDQFLGYAWLANVNVVYEDRIGLQQNVPDSKRFRRIPAHFPDEVIQNWTISATERILRFINAIDHDVFLENYDSCESGYGPCQYHNVCMQPKNFQDEMLRVEFATREKAWDPRGSE